MVKSIESQKFSEADENRYELTNIICAHTQGGARIDDSIRAIKENRDPGPTRARVRERGAISVTDHNVRFVGRN